MLDVERGTQPMPNGDGSIRVVLNGEVFNHMELRRELEDKGYRFRSSHSDTEVLAHLYESEGIERLLLRLNGMFALAVWDDRLGELHLARDRAGIKPLYYAIRDREVVFASELKSILAVEPSLKQPNPEAIHHYLSLKHVPAPLTAFRGIAQLRPGERIVVSRSGVQLERWWRLRFEEDDSIDESSAATELRELLADSVRLQGQADVPVGVFLSGGLDSSAVAALFSGVAKGGFDTYTLAYRGGLEHKELDRRYAQLMSDVVHSRHHVLEIGPEELTSRLDAIVEAFDEPFGGVTSTYFLSSLAAKQVKAVLTGDGADELFGSYLPHREAQAAADAGLAPMDEVRSRMARFAFDEASKRALYTPAMSELVSGVSTETLLRDWYDASGTNDLLNRALYVDFESLLPDQVLAFSDRLSMAHSLEVRPPFLDPRVIDLASRLPGRLKIKEGRTKHILKEALRGVMPQGLIDRPKEGFVLPLAQWLKGPIRGWAASTLAPERLALHGWIDPQRARRVLDESERGSGAPLWNLVMFQLWWERQFG